MENAIFSNDTKWLEELKPAFAELGMMSFHPFGQVPPARQLGTVVLDWRGVDVIRQQEYFDDLLRHNSALAKAGMVMIAPDEILMQRLPMAICLSRQQAVAADVLRALKLARRYGWTDTNLFDTQMDMFKSLLQQMAEQETLEVSLSLALAVGEDQSGLRQKYINQLQLLVHHARAAWQVRRETAVSDCCRVPLPVVVDNALALWHRWDATAHPLKVRLGNAQSAALYVNPELVTCALAASCLGMLQDGGQMLVISATVEEEDWVLLGLLNQELVTDEHLREVPAVRLEWPLEAPVVDPLAVMLAHRNPCGVHLQFARAVAEAHGGSALVQQVGEKLAGFYLRLPTA